jgi:hypothetical protein
MKIHKNFYRVLVALVMVVSTDPMYAMASARAAVAAVKKAGRTVIDFTPAGVFAVYKQQQKHIEHFKTQEKFIQEPIPLSVRNEISNIFEKNNLQVTCIYQRGIGRDFSPQIAITSQNSQALLMMNESAIQAFKGNNTERYTPEHMKAVVLHELGHAIHRHTEKALWIEGVRSLVRCSSAFTFFYQNWEYFHQVWGGTFGGHTHMQWPTIVASLGLLLSSNTVALRVYNILWRHFEREADGFVLKTADASHIQALKDFFGRFKGEEKEEYSWHLSSHPRMSERIEACEKELARLQTPHT